MRVDELETPLRFVVTVDTEADDAWSRPADLQLANLQQIPRFQDLCDKINEATEPLRQRAAEPDEAEERRAA